MFYRIVPKQSNEHRYLKISDPDAWFNQHAHAHTQSTCWLRKLINY